MDRTPELHVEHGQLLGREVIGLGDDGTTERDRTRIVRSEVRELRRPLQRLAMRESLCLTVADDLFPELQSRLDVPEGLAEREQRLGRPSGRDRVLERARELAGFPVVPGEFCVAADRRRRETRLTGERLGEPRMGALAFPRQQAGEDGLLEQGVTEPDDTVVGHVDDPCVDRLPEGRREIVGVVAADDDLEQLVANRLTADRGETKNVTSTVREVVDPCEDQVPQLGPDVVSSRSKGLEDLGGVERVPARSLHQLVDHARRRRFVQERCGELGQLTRVERLERQMADQRTPVELGQDGPERVAPGHLVAAIGTDQRDRGISEVDDEEREQVTRGRVRPVEVLQHQTHTPPLARCSQKVRDRSEQPQTSFLGDPLIGADVADLGQEQRELGHLVRHRPDDVALLGRSEVVEGVAHRHERQRALRSVDARPDHDRGRSRVGTAHELTDEARLADSCVAADEPGRHTGLVAVRSGGKYGKIRLATHEGRRA